MIYSIYRLRIKFLFLKKDNEVLLKRFNESIREAEVNAMTAMTEGQERERTRIARDLHDRLGSTLSLVKIHFKSLEERLDELDKKELDKKEFAEDSQRLRNAMELLDTASDDVRRMAHDMASGVLMKFGLIPAIDDLAETINGAKNGLEVNVYTLAFNERLSYDIELSVYRIVQELVTNVLRHADAKSVSVSLAMKKSTLILSISDDGTGFDLKTSKEQGTGLKNVEARAQKLKGRLTIDSQLGVGTFVEVSIPVEAPEEVINQGQKAIDTWMNAEKKAFMYEAKIILIGSGGVGKTTLCENLLDGNYGISTHESTPGLEIRHWITEVEHQGRVVNFRFNIWDFGGQGKYRAVQQFFCSRNTIYLYVTDVNDDDENSSDKYVGLRYWNDLINSFSVRGGRVSNPLIYVYNKIDKDPQYIRSISKRKQDMDELPDTPKVNNIRPVSCLNGKGLDELRSDILSMLKHSNEELLSKKYPTRWLSLKKELEGLSANYISFEQYEFICDKHGLDISRGEEELSEAELWLQTLHDIGIVVYFGKVPYLKNIIILKPDWLRAAAYDVLSCQRVILNLGKFFPEDFEHIWPKNTRDERDRLIELMKAFELCYEDDGSRRFLVPALFSENPPKEYQGLKALITHEKFDQVSVKCIFSPILPAGAFHKLLIKEKRRILRNICWQTGAVFQFGKSFIEVQDSWTDNTVYLVGFGVDIAKHLEYMVRCIENLLHTDYKPDLTLSTVLNYKDEEFDFIKLLDQLRSGGDYIYSKHHKSLIFIKDLIQGLPIESKQNELYSIRRIRDLISKNEIKKAITGLERQVNWVDPSLGDELVMLKFRANELDQQIRFGSISSTEADRTKKTIVKSALDLTNLLEKEISE
ncbi:MAG: GTP-binding protein [Roseivirga sp.]|nr:GTP-binding protein [Roseivirga sp.]